MSNSIELLKARAIYFCGNALILIGWAIMIYGLLLFGWQCLASPYKGASVELPAMLFFADKPPLGSSSILILQVIPTFSWEWLHAPERWLELHKIVHWVLSTLNVSFVTVLTGFETAALGDSAQHSQVDTIYLLERQAAKHYRIAHDLE